MGTCRSSGDREKCLFDAFQTRSRAAYRALERIRVLSGMWRRKPSSQCQAGMNENAPVEGDMSRLDPPLSFLRKARELLFPKGPNLSDANSRFREATGSVSAAPTRRCRTCPAWQAFSPMDRPGAVRRIPRARAGRLPSWPPRPAGRLHPSEEADGCRA